MEREGNPVPAIRQQTEQTVLLADDDADSRSIYGRILARAGYRVVNVASGADALTKASTVHPDIIVLDLGLPDMHGLEVVSALQANQATTGMQIVILTGYGSAEDQPRARAAGCKTYLLKPVLPRDLISAIQNAANAAPVAMCSAAPTPAVNTPGRPKPARRRTHQVGTSDSLQIALANPTLF